MSAAAACAVSASVLDSGPPVSAALWYADGWGVLVVPADPKLKKPLIKTGKGHREHSSRDPNVITSWSQWSHPGVRVAVVTGEASGVLVIDCDRKPGVDGVEALRDLEERYGPLPNSPRQQTRRGEQRVFRYPRGAIIKSSASVLAPGVDIRANGGIIIAPPAPDRCWLIDAHPSDTTLADLPPAWIEALVALNNRSNRRPDQQAKKIRDRIPEGAGRNSELTSLAGTLRRRGLTGEQILDHLTLENRRRCVPPLEDDELRSIAFGMERYAPASTAMPEPLTDLGNARRFVAQHGKDVRHCDRLGGWLVWGGKCWQRDETGCVYRFAKATAERIWTEIEFTEDAYDKNAIARHAHRSQTDARIKAMLSLAWSESGVPFRASDFDADPFLLTCANGTVDLRTGDLQPYRREDLITKLVPVPFDTGAACPLWLKTLELVFAGNAQLASFLQRAAGYSLTGDVSAQCLFFVYGTGENGKSTIVDTLLTLAGDYGRQAQPDLLMVHWGEVHPTGLADLCGARFVASIEVEEGRRLAEVMVKWVTGGDRLKARLMRQDFFEFQPTHKLWLVGNHKPVIRGTDHAIWRRIHLIPFTVRIADVTKPDPHFRERLRAELPGILRWAVDGCLAWQREGLNPPVEVLAATEGYRQEMDVLGDFLAECCVQESDATATLTELHDAYGKWCERTRESPLKQRAFGNALSERGFKPDRTRQSRFRRGLRLQAGVTQ